MKYEARVSHVAKVGPRLILMSVDADGTPVPLSYTTPGQYVLLSTETSRPGYFSIASSPGEPTLEFLIRYEPNKEKTGPLAKLSAGDTVLVSEAAGPGYPLLEQEGRNLLLIATGTGIAPLRALLHVLVPHRERFGRITLLHGAVDEASLAFRDELDEWSAMGVDVHLCLSRPTAAWPHERGHVHDALPHLIHDPENLSVFLCGHPGMIEKVTRCLVDHRVGTDRIFINH